MRFVVGGGINTGFTIALYLVLNVFLTYQLAYLLSYLAGIAFSYWFNSVIVFHVPLSWKGLLSFPLVYVVQYPLSAAVLGGLVEILRIRESFAPLLVAMIMVPATYLISKVVLEWGHRRKAPRLNGEHPDGDGSGLDIE